MLLNLKLPDYIDLILLKLSDAILFSHDLKRKQHILNKIEKVCALFNKFASMKCYPTLMRAFTQNVNCVINLSDDLSDDHRRL